MLRIRDIFLVRIRIRGSKPLTYASVSGSCYFRQWPSRWHLHKTVGIKVFSYCFCLMIEGSGAGSGFIPHINGSGSGRPKNVRIRIRNTDRISFPQSWGSVYINSMCDIKFWKDIENLRSVYKKTFFEFWAVSSVFDLFQLSKKFIVPSKRWKLFFFE